MLLCSIWRKILVRAYYEDKIMACGPWCVYYRDRHKLSKDGICNRCPDFEGSRARPDLEQKVDIFRLAELLKEKEEKKRRTKIPQLSDCPSCSKHSLFYNPVEDSFECLNLDCSARGKPIRTGSEGHKSILSRILKEEEK